MSNILEKRIEALENQLFVDTEGLPSGIFYHVDMAEGVPQTPVKGWQMHDLKIMRKENETDEELNTRAISEAKTLLTHPLAVPVFYPIYEGEQD
jgi:hypothetical protein